MARSVTTIELMIARFNMFQAIATEQQMAAYPDAGYSYPPGIASSADQADNLEVLETIYIQETPSA
jgi:hypothetical protein